MKAQLEQRLEKLKAEFESGQRMLADVEARQTKLQNTLLRISGAIQSDPRIPLRFIRATRTRDL